MQNTLKVVVILLAVLAVALLIGIFYVSDRKQKEIDQYATKQQEQTMEVDALNAQIKRHKDDLKVKEDTEAALKTQLEQATTEKTALAEQLARATNELTSAATQLTTATKTVETLKADKTQMQTKIDTLNGQVARLDTRIKRLEEEIVRGENNRELLLKELASLRIEKANMERKFNDIDDIRAQYKNLRHDEILESRRRWSAQGYDGFYTRSGVFETKKPYQSPASQYDLKAEIRLTANTNRAPHQIADKPGR